MRAGRRAQALIELVIALPFILLVILGLFDVTRAVWMENTLAYAAREGTRYAIVHGAGSTQPLGPNNASEPNIAAVVRNNAIGVHNITITTAWPDGGNDRGMRISVDATAPFVPVPSQYLLGGALTITLKGGSMLVIEH